MAVDYDIVCLSEEIECKQSGRDTDDSQNGSKFIVVFHDAPFAPSEQWKFEMGSVSDNDIVQFIAKRSKKLCVKAN
jgi:hypothetical protein